MGTERREREKPSGGRSSAFPPIQTRLSRSNKAYLQYKSKHRPNSQMEEKKRCSPEIENETQFVEWAQNEIAVVPDFQKRNLFSDEAHFWLNGYVNKQNCRIWSEANPQVYVETPLHPEKMTVWCALWAGGILQKR
ncbi:hypothetical protein TNCV_3867851 [Trichonephila clavipes]|nr:hypothetical protein TNCV_3867851 [Trichonephila clavipes]